MTIQEIADRARAIMDEWNTLAKEADKAHVHIALNEWTGPIVQDLRSLVPLSTRFQSLTIIA